jgi:hypothetical protein
MLVAVTSVQWAAVGAVSAALFGGAGWVVSLIGHRRDKTVIGIKRRVHVMPFVRVILQPTEGFALPKEWGKSKVRCFGMDLLNPSPYQMVAAVHVEKIRVGFAYRQLPAKVIFTKNDKGGISLAPSVPEMVWVLIYNENGWKSEKPIRMFVKFRVHSTAKEHRLIRRVWLQPLDWEGGI